MRTHEANKFVKNPSQNTLRHKSWMCALVIFSSTRHAMLLRSLEAHDARKLQDTLKLRQNKTSEGSKLQKLLQQPIAAVVLQLF